MRNRKTKLIFQVFILLSAACNKNSGNPVKVTAPIASPSPEEKEVQSADGDSRFNIEFGYSDWLSVASYKGRFLIAQQPNFKLSEILNFNQILNFEPFPISRKTFQSVLVNGNNFIIWNESSLRESRDLGKTFQQTDISTKKSMISVEKSVAYCGDSIYVADDSELVFRKTATSAFEKHSTFVKMNEDRIFGIWCNSKSVFINYKNQIHMAPRETMVFSPTTILPPKDVYNAFVTENIFHERKENSIFQTKLSTGERLELQTDAKIYEPMSNWQDETSYVHSCTNGDGICFTSSSLKLKPIVNISGCGDAKNFEFVGLVSGKFLIRSSPFYKLKLCISEENNSNFRPVEVDENL